MGAAQIHAYAVWAELALGLLTFVSLFFIDAPYGRYTRGGWGPEVSQRLGWVLMELPAVVFVLGIYLAGRNAFELVPLVFLAMWQAHYVHRTFVFPFRLKADGKKTPLSIVLTAVVFNSLNAYVNARWISEVGHYDPSWLMDPRFVAGLALFVTGYVINHQSDAILMSLRKPGETGYKIPVGGLYRYITCPNYFGEILEWTGWAVATWSLAGAAFAVYTIANLAPRALAHHRWYHSKFPDYPPERKAIIPFVV